MPDIWNSFNLNFGTAKPSFVKPYSSGNKNNEKLYSMENSCKTSQLNHMDNVVLQPYGLCCTLVIYVIPVNTHKTKQ